MATKRPLVFIGSSTEGLPVAKAVQANLDYCAECVIWHQGGFGLSEGSLESLVNKLDEWDFGVLVLTPDDFVESRGARNAVPRDNVLLELGLFVGRLGRERTFMVVDRSAKLKLPSDLAGITPATFQPPESGLCKLLLARPVPRLKTPSRKLADGASMESKYKQACMRAWTTGKAFRSKSSTKVRSLSLRTKFACFIQNLAVSFVFLQRRMAHYCPIKSATIEAGYLSEKVSPIIGLCLTSIWMESNSMPPTTTAMLSV
jgi:hypothetical protein